MERKVKTCPRCGIEAAYHEGYDAYFCPRCNEWLEETCGDPNCEFCANRPEKPQEAGYKLLLPFENQDPNFALGFEAGLLYSAMKLQLNRISGYFNSENQHQYEAMAKVMGYSIFVEDYDEYWKHFTFNFKEE